MAAARSGTTPPPPAREKPAANLSLRNTTMPPSATRVPATWRTRRRSTFRMARMMSVKSGPLVSPSDEENGVDRLMPYITTPMCAAWPMSPATTKRDRSRRRGQVCLMRRRKMTSRSAKPSSGSTAKRTNISASTPIPSSTCFTNAKLTPQTNMVAKAAASDSWAFDHGSPERMARQSKICGLMKPETPIAARAAVRALTASKIRELYNEGIGRSDILAFWVGEPDEPTPQFIRRAGIDSIAAGEVFYTHNHGIPELREALASYVTRLPPRHSGAAGGARILRDAAAPAGVRRANRRDERGRQRVDARFAAHRRPRRARGRGGAALAQPPGDPEDPGRPRHDGGAVVFSVGLAARARPPDRRPHARHARAVPEFAEQSDRLDHHPRRAEGAPRALPAARHLDFRRRCLRASLLRTGWSRTFLPEARGRERPPDQREYVFQVLAHDRVAPGLAGGAGRPRRRPGQADRVQHLLCARVRPACGACRARARGAGARTYR